MELAAAEWLARRDRGLRPAEQDGYLQWLRENPQHGAAIARLERTWTRLDTLQHWQPAHSSQPNPDLLAPRPPRRWMIPSLLTAAAALAIAAITFFDAAPPTPSRGAALIHPGPERMTLADGSLVELNTGAKIEVNFTGQKRSVRLVSGEAHFAVAKDPSRPFVVSADSFAVVAVGTAFSMHVNDAALSVLVTEGTVRLDALPANPTTAPRGLTPVVAGQQAIVSIDSPANDSPRFHVRDLTPAEIESALAWQRLRLEFSELALRDVVREFNRYNSRKLVIEDDATGDLLIGGSFRADNVESFVRLLDAGFDIEARPRGSELVLVRRR